MEHDESELLERSASQWNTNGRRSMARSASGGEGKPSRAVSLRQGATTGRRASQKAISAHASASGKAFETSTGRRNSAETNVNNTSTHTTGALASRRSFYLGGDGPQRGTSARFAGGEDSQSFIRAGRVSTTGSASTTVAAAYKV